jgi:hypothetical protein
MYLILRFALDSSHEHVEVSYVHIQMDYVGLAILRSTIVARGHQLRPV